MKDSNLVLGQNSEELNSLEDEFLPPLLPRSGWNNQISYLRVIFRAKRALDRIEREADLLNQSN